MRERNLINLTLIILLAVLSAVIVAPIQKPDFLKGIAFWQDAATRDLQIKQGLDLKGGLQILMSTELPEGTTVTPDQMETARRIIENRVNGLGVTEPVVQTQGDERILIELPGLTTQNREQALSLIKQTGQLEFVDGGSSPPPDGSTISTTYQTSRALLYPNTTTGGNPISATAPISGVRVLQTAFTGEIIATARAGLSQVGQYVVDFTIRGASQSPFGEYTASRIGQSMCIVLDHVVLSCPVIRANLREGGQISGNFNNESANELALTLSYGSLPVPLKIETTRDVGATLGAESIRRSIIAGVIGLLVLLVFMMLYYRVPGVIAAGSIVFFTLASLALFVLIPITLTLPGIAGFVLSIATAADANILVLERFKEELRSGRTIRASVETAFQRAWPSIRDSNISTIITCVILLFFGNTFGASAVRGFALNLILGILLSMFSAMFVTRTFMRLAFFNQPSEATEQRKALLGV
jgi:preprotein translocase subunit SecD